MAGGPPDQVDVVVLPPDPHAFLDAGGPRERRALLAEEVRDELVHPGVGEQRSPRMVRDQPGTRAPACAACSSKNCVKARRSAVASMWPSSLRLRGPASAPGAAPPPARAWCSALRAGRPAPPRARPGPCRRPCPPCRLGRYLAVATLTLRWAHTEAPIPRAAPAPNHRARRSISRPARTARRPARAVPARKAMTLISGPENASLRQPGRRSDRVGDGLGRTDQIVDAIELAPGAGHGHLDPAEHHRGVVGELVGQGSRSCRAVRSSDRAAPTRPRPPPWRRR